MGVTKVRSTTTSASANAALASPLEITCFFATLGGLAGASSKPSAGRSACSTGASGCMASKAFVTAGRSSYSTFTAAAAASASALDAAATAATAWPW